MNTNGNTYTVIYSTVLVILVAAILAFVAMSLQDKQNENVKIETITKVLTAAAQSDENVSIDETTDVLGMYTDNIVDAFYVDGNGEVTGHMNMGKENVKDIQVPSTSDLKKQNDILKKISGSKDSTGQAELLKSLNLPVFVFDINGKEVTVIPCYGAGLWGPIWGYVALASDGRTIEGAIFDHKGETPGLGAKIAEAPFYTSFRGKAFGSGDVVFAVEKGKHEGEPECVDAISGATITSQALGKGINLWAKHYQPYLNKAAAEKAGTEADAEDTADMDAAADAETIK
ncbi:MAG: NADH:ubiquinone reductase (Na(+)-transporting) subunit C [Bacteroidetes bacterium]|uniref:Na(+)-translocating NADH-quinone reductase subunit C n=1 Tax=Candidatus Cryptobacteroides merdavium TaxID=2840769 RepID=A0A9D9EB89_9BACT|nr:NADH:ubiquinone reductase (Na(+)-transporting) subunit C [Candidatus Cryptobacteroides merdavium]